MRRTGRDRYHAIILFICLLTLDKANGMSTSSGSRSTGIGSSDSTEEETSMGTRDRGKKSSTMSDSGDDDRGSDNMEANSGKSDHSGGYSSMGRSDRYTIGSSNIDEDGRSEKSSSTSALPSSDARDESEELTSTTVLTTYNLIKSTDMTTLAYSCPPENVTVSGIPLTFDTADSGTIANSTQFCPRGTPNSHLRLATRLCLTEWLEPILNDCYNYSNLEVELGRIAEGVIIDGNASDVAIRLLLASNQPKAINSNGLESILDTLEGIVQVESNSSTLTDSVIGVIDNILEIDTETVDKVPRVEDVMELIEDQLSNVQQSQEHYEEKGENVAARATRVKRSILEVPFEFVDPFEGNQKQNDKSFSRTAIKLPPSILDQIPVNVTEVPLTFFVFRETDIFMMSGGDDVISPVISAKVDMDNVTIRNLPEESPVIIDFEQMNGKDGKDFEEDAICVFWYKPNNVSRGRWSTEGCEKRTFENRIQCLCNHLTSFAILVRGEPDSERYTNGYYRALNLVTTVGCYMSAVVLMLCLILMIAVKKLRVKLETQVHMNLCLALIGFYLTFVIGVERTRNPHVCKVISTLIHWFCLSSLAWMSVEAYVIYKVIYKFDLGSINKYFIFYSLLFGWGMPAVSAILVYFLDKSHDYTLEPDFCFLHQGVGFYFGFFLLVVLLTTYNAIVFVLACYRILCRTINAADKKGYKQEVVKRVWITFLFWVLLGLGWICGIFSSLYSKASVLFQVLFCVSLSLQGVFLFYFLCVQNPGVQKRVRRLIMDENGSYRINISRSSAKTDKTFTKSTSNVYSQPTV